MVGPCTTATTFPARGCSYKVTVAASPPKIYFRPGLYHLSFCLCYLPPPRGRPHNCAPTSLVTVAKSGIPDDGAMGQPTGLQGHGRGLP